ncbi:bifunctional DNA-formamidopyrimidine glycosylase/DNA-(apurinic or apyrimidinic site) lyase [Candidatus Curtissbacteria bacterium]|nr:bifunctional DNA-formamidopyrimidine glycosylase/DNA-(apurinic or apyrimidinic site) lyase [Candidatus Curtissbacteria bacterium]
MPELPEVTVITNSLNKKIRGLVMRGIEYDWPKKFYWAAGPRGPLARRGMVYVLNDLSGMKVERVDRVGKVIIIALEKGISILIHLKLTGQLIYQDKKTRIAGGHPIPPLNLPVPNKTTRVTFGFTNGGHLYFNDMRKFGWVKIIENGKLKMENFLGKLGPDPLVMSYEQFRDRLSKKKGRIKKTLMDQTFISGVGNIYSDEALWLAKIHPARSVESLAKTEIKALFDGLRESLKLAIEKGGSSANSFVDSGGERGLFLSFAKAYHMTGRPCARCKTPIVRKKMDGRSAHFCPSCQKLL